MIELTLKAAFDHASAPYVVKVTGEPSSPGSIVEDMHDAQWSRLEDGTSRCVTKQGAFVVSALRSDDSLDGDVLLCQPERGVIQRLIRRTSPHNTLLFTENCDQLCRMCSQPPRRVDDAWLWPLYEEALALAEPDMTIGISGGEPTLFKDELFGMVERTAQRRPDIGYHILSNGQHFSDDDRDRLVQLHRQSDILWGIPLYSYDAASHDQLVGKAGAFDPLMSNLMLLASTGASIELRTVLTAQNVMDLPALATFVATHLPFVSVWAIMAMEPIGFAKANRRELFFDHSVFPEPLLGALDVATLRHVSARLYNFPLCTIPAEYRHFCADSISDWKKVYQPACEPCSQRENCAGFFAWYDERSSWAHIQPIEGDGIS